MPLPVIPATTPTTTPAVAARIYDRWWISDIQFPNGSNPKLPVAVRIRLHRAAVLPDGSYELSRTDPPRFVQIADLLGAASKDDVLAAAVQSLLAAVVKVGTAQKLL